MAELKPCGCGSVAVAIKYSWGEWSVICLNEICFNETGFFNTEAEAIEAWNKRVGETK